MRWFEQSYGFVRVCGRWRAIIGVLGCVLLLADLGWGYLFLVSWVTRGVPVFAWLWMAILLWV